MEEYVGKHRAENQVDYYRDEHGFKLMTWSANHTSQHPIIRHTAEEGGKYKPRHGYGGRIRTFLFLTLGLDLFGKINIADDYVTSAI